MSARNVNFGQIGNEQLCSCGKHRGVGLWSPEARAASYAWTRAKLRSLFNDDQREFLTSWEEAHGKVIPSLEPAKSSQVFGDAAPKQKFTPTTTAPARSWHEVN